MLHNDLFNTTLMFKPLGVGMSLELPYYVLFVPVISLVSMIPISIAGLGVQEGAFVYLFSLTEMNLAMILSMALLVRMLVVVSVLPGAILYLQELIGVIPVSSERKNSYKNEELMSGDHGSIFERMVS